MKYTFYALAAVSLLLMLLGAIQVFSHWDGGTGSLPGDSGTLMGMGDRGVNDPAYQQLPTLEKKQMIDQYLYDREVAPVHRQEFDPRIFQGTEKRLPGE